MHFKTQVYVSYPRSVLKETEVIPDGRFFSQLLAHPKLLSKVYHPSKIPILLAP